jgi:MoaA/NifB/PqqE/SkfB family radical SAM enzyme
VDNRLTKPDTDYFENRRLIRDVDFNEIRTGLSAMIRMALSDGHSASDDLVGVLEYLANSEQHDSEGRDLAVDKRSFSRTELRVCATLAAAKRTPYLLYRYRFNMYPRQHRAPAMPVILAVEPTSVCNIKCVMCFQMDHELSGRRSMRGFMSRVLYKQIVEEAAAKGVGGIVLASRGEPLLHPEIVDFVRLAKTAGIIDVKLNTNATRLDERTARGLLDAGLDTLVFSVDSAVKEQFEKIRIGAKFDRIVANIRRFNEIRAAEFPSSATRTRISMVLVDSEQDTVNAVEFWRSMVDEFAVRWAIPRLGIYDQAARPERRPCSLLWERLYIWWDGIVNTCDEDYLSKLQIGQLVEGAGPTVEELWHGQTIDRYRRLHVDGRKNEMSPCSNCPGF